MADAKERYRELALESYTQLCSTKTNSPLFEKMLADFDKCQDFSSEVESGADKDNQKDSNDMEISDFENNVDVIEVI